MRLRADVGPIRQKWCSRNIRGKYKYRCRPRRRCQTCGRAVSSEHRENHAAGATLIDSVRLASPLIRGEEQQLILLDRSAKGEPKLVLPQDAPWLAGFFIEEA